MLEAIVIELMKGVILAVGVIAVVVLSHIVSDWMNK